MNNRVLYGVLTLLLNQFGITYFMQGKTKTAILRILLAIVTCGVIGWINLVMGVILGIKILKMTDEEFAAADKSTLLTGIPFGK